MTALRPEGTGMRRRIGPAALAVVLVGTAGACRSQPLGPGGPPVAVRIELAAGAPMYSVGATQTLRATPKDASGNDVSGLALTWSSNAPAVANVSSAGVVTAAGDGQATITVTGAGLTASTAISVSARFRYAVRVMRVDQPDLEVRNDTTSATLTATIRR